MKKGFTLIELSIVLVIIGLIVGGILVGRDLISAAAVRAQISQIEKYQAAANTFKAKYAYLLGDIPDPDATKFGFALRGTNTGEGDGNGVIEANYNDIPNGNNGYQPMSGEEALFWDDLSKVNLVDGSFTGAVAAGTSLGVGWTGMAGYYPSGKIGNDTYIYVFSGGWQEYYCIIMGNCVYGSPLASTDGRNYFGLSKITGIIGVGGPGLLFDASPAMTVAQAYAIDKKMDDGLPQTGKVLAMAISGWINKYNKNGVASTDPTYGGPVTSTADIGAPNTATTCYDGVTSGLPMQYSLTTNKSGLTCQLSFQFQ